MPSLRRRHAAVLLITGLMAVGVAACGGDDAGSTASGAASSKSEGAAASTTAKAGEGSSSETTKPDVSGIGKDKDFCAGYAKAEKAFGGDDADFDPAQLDELGPVVKDLAGKAPTELKADMQLLSDAFAKAAPLLKKASTMQEELKKDPSKAASMAADMEKLTKDLEVFSSQEFDDASSRVTAYAEQKCGIKSN